MFNREFELWEQPAQELYNKSEFLCEMNDQDHAFLCGLMKNKKPKKVLEIGVAEGGTTAVIINCLSLMQQRCEVYSVDLSKSLYYDNRKKTGYEYDRLESFIDQKSIIHHMLLGQTIANRIEKIGTGIEFVIIDTTHHLPGEILDFLCILPYLAKDAIVVLHDVNLNYVRAMWGTREEVIESHSCVATKLLFSAITAKKYKTIDQNNLFNIAAFMISEDTYKYVENLFYLLTSTWTYIPEDKILKGYRTIYEMFYSQDCLELYDIAVANNRDTFRNIQQARDMEKEFERFQFPYDRVPTGSRIALYGAGRVGKEIYKILKNKGIYQIVIWLDKNYEKYAKEGLEVERPETIQNIEFDFIVVAVEKEDTFKMIRQDIMVNSWDAGKPIIGPMRK